MHDLTVCPCGVECCPENDHRFWPRPVEPLLWDGDQA